MFLFGNKYKGLVVFFGGLGDLLESIMAVREWIERKKMSFISIKILTFI